MLLQQQTKLIFEKKAKAGMDENDKRLFIKEDI